MTAKELVDILSSVEPNARVCIGIMTTYSEFGSHSISYESIAFVDKGMKYQCNLVIDNGTVETVKDSSMQYDEQCERFVDEVYELYQDLIGNIESPEETLIVIRALLAALECINKNK